jgi:hypothetical protein
MAPHLEGVSSNPWLLGFSQPLQVVGVAFLHVRQAFPWVAKAAERCAAADLPNPALSGDIVDALA